MAKVKKKANYIYEYHKAIQKGHVVVGKLIKKIFEILVAAIDSGDFLFDHKKANKAIRFIENFCRHCEGSNDLFILELWQKAVVSAIFGIVDSNGLRQFREVFIVIARKNGKSLFASAIIACMAYIDGEYGAKIYCVAPKLDQASIVYDNFYQMIKQDDELISMIKRRKADLYIESTNSSIKRLAFNSKKSDGFNPHLTVCDEIAAWRGDQGLKQYEVMKSALGSRKQPLILSISTSGYVDDSIYDELMKRSTAFLNGASDEKRLLPFLYIIDDIDKCFDMNELKKSNPNLNVSVSEDFYIEEIKVAKTSLSKRAEYLCKFCNIKQNSSIAWLDHNVVGKAAKAKYKLEDFRGCYCVGGVDLSQSTDLTAACIIVEKDRKLYSITQFFMPKKRFEKAIVEDNIPYNIFLKKGFLKLSGENYIDYKDVTAWFLMLLKQYKIKPLQIGYDKWNAKYWNDEMQSNGFHTDWVTQGENLSPVLQEFEGIIKDELFYIGNNDLLKTHLLNVAVKINTETRRMKPVKLEARLRIDGFVAILDAMTVRQKWYSKYGNLLSNNKK